MHVGALVSKKSRWGVDSQLIGIVVCKSDTIKDGWIVLWTLSDNKYKLQDHIASALIDLHTVSTNSIISRTQITL